MQLACYASSFFILKSKDAGREFRFLDSLFGLFALRNVSRHCKLHDDPIIVPKGSGMGFHVAALTAQSDHVELQRTPLATADSIVEVTKAVLVFRGNQVINTPAHD